MISSHRSFSAIVTSVLVSIVILLMIYSESRGVSSKANAVWFVRRPSLSGLLSNKMAFNGNGNEVPDFEFMSSVVPNGLSKINTKSTEVCKDDTTPPVKVTNVEELHALQRKKASAPTTPRTATNPSTPRSMTPRSYVSEEELHKQQMHSVRYNLHT